MMLTWNILLSFIWLACWGNSSATQFVVGFVLGFFLLRFCEKIELIQNSKYTDRVIAAFELFCFFLVELWKSNLRMAFDILRLKSRSNPALVAVPLSLKTDWGITLLGNLITLTPGTLSMDLSDNKDIIYIHTFFFDNNDKKAFIASIKNGFERKILFLEGQSAGREA